MKYKELIQFEPITTVIKLVNANNTEVAEELVRTFVFSKRMQEDIQEIILKNLNPNPNYETMGIQVVGSYGTGKSHLMSLVSAIAENASLINLLQNEELKSAFKKIAGNYKVLRFEIGIDKPLKEIFFTQVERYLDKEGIKFVFKESDGINWKEMIQQMMSEFETKFHETRNDDLPQIFKHEGEKVDFTPYLTISVLVFLIFALFLATSIFLTSC